MYIKNISTIKKEHSTSQFLQAFFHTYIRVHVGRIRNTYKTLKRPSKGIWDIK
jgi:hypothetical protein